MGCHPVAVVQYTFRHKNTHLHTNGSHTGENLGGGGNSSSSSGSRSSSSRSNRLCYWLHVCVTLAQKFLLQICLNSKSVV